MEAPGCRVFDVEKQREGKHQSHADQTRRNHSGLWKQVKTVFFGVPFLASFKVHLARIRTHNFSAESLLPELAIPWAKVKQLILQSIQYLVQLASTFLEHSLLFKNKVMSWLVVEINLQPSS